MEPEIIEGYYQVKFYSYRADFQELMTVALTWIKKHPECDVEDVLVGADEGTWVCLYFRKG